MKATKLRIIALCAAMLALSSCPDLFGPLDNPVDPEAESYQGFPTVGSLSEIAPAGPAAGASHAGNSLVVTKVSGADRYAARIASSEAGLEAAAIYEGATNSIDISGAPLADATTYWWQARASLDGGVTWGPWSAVSSFTTAWALSAAPALDPPGGKYSKAQSVTITCATVGATIFYTTDGSDPASSATRASGPSPLGPIAAGIDPATTIRAIATAPWRKASSEASAKYEKTLILMVDVPAGSFNNGTSEVSLSAFLMGRTEVTQGQYQTVMGSNPSSYTGDTSRPVEQVSWYDALVFCNKLSMQEGFAPVYTISGSTNPASWGAVPTTSSSKWDAATMIMSANGYRLPTEAEWEYAARGGTPVDSFTYAGSNTAGDVAWYDTYTTRAVAGKKPNKLSLYDMSGNVREWCWDRYGSYASGAQTDPVGTASGSYRVLRGGSWNDHANGCTVSYRYSYSPDNRAYYHGFRVVRRVGPTAATPSFDPPGGIYASDQNVTISCATSGATIYYTTDGSMPTTGSTQYTGAINVTVNPASTLRAIAIATGYSQSAIGTASYSVFMPIISVPAGRFNNGTSDVTLTAFQMSVTEVTQGQYEKVMGNIPSNSYGVGSNYPVYNVNWYAALVFCNKLSLLEGFTPVYTISGSTNPSSWGMVPTSNNSTWNAATMNINANGYRLPTEAEWEYAARGGTPVDSFTYSGSSKIDDVAWYSSNSGSTTHAVGGKAANKLGLYDMSGNVKEWCWDWYGSYPSGAQTDPTGAASGSGRVARGGGSSDATNSCSVSYRENNAPYNQYYSNGFRIVRRP
jgi:formylglycine-generating enzyme required for sulfatase activity